MYHGTEPLTEPPLQEEENGDACGVAMGLRTIACIRALTSAPASAVAEGTRIRGSGSERDRASPHGAHAHPRRPAKPACASRHTQDQARSARSNSARERASCTRRGTEAGFGTLSRARGSRTALIDGSFPVSARSSWKPEAVFKLYDARLRRAVGQTHQNHSIHLYWVWCEQTGFSD